MRGARRTYGSLKAALQVGPWGVESGRTSAHLLSPPSAVAFAPRPGAVWERGERTGRVWLVGAGPGDPDLITVKGLRALRRTEAVVYDRLAAPELLDECPATAVRYDVGKVPGRRGFSQDEINALLVELALSGARVVRLKGGDPFVFGRGGEEAQALAAAGIPFEVVPGVTSAFAAPAAAGIPVTYRGVARSVTVATGYAESGALEAEWAALARTPGTLIFLMAVEHLERIVAGLLSGGRAADEPAALVRWGTTSRQAVWHAPLGEIVGTARTAGVKPPAVLVVGPTVALATHLAPGSPKVEAVRLLRVAGL